MRARLKVRLHNTSASHLNGSFKMAQQSKGISKFVLALVQLSIASALARLMWEMLLHHTPSLENFHGLLSMSSCTVCPCFCISASFSQLASSTGWFFHLTRYSKYCFRLVLLLTLLSSMHSICGLSCNWHLLRPLDHWLLISSLCFFSLIWVQIRDIEYRRNSDPIG
jgi:hypothetical protein